MKYEAIMEMEKRIKRKQKWQEKTNETK